MPHGARRVEEGRGGGRLPAAMAGAVRARSRNRAQGGGTDETVRRIARLAGHRAMGRGVGFPATFIALTGVQTTRA